MLNRSPNSRIQPGTWLLKFVLPAVLIGGGIAIFTMLGATAPRKLAGDSAELSAVLQRIPIVEIGYVKPYDPAQTLDVGTNGVVVPLREITVAAEVAGRIVYKNEKCRAGNFVEAGELLFSIDDQDYRLEVERLAALRQSEYLQQQELEQEISNSQRVIEVAQEEMRLQEREIDRLLELPQGFASQTELDTARRARLASLNSLTTQQNQFDMLRTRRTRIELAEKLAATQLRLAEVNLKRTEVRAAISGLIVSETVQADTFVQRGESLCVMEDISAAEVSCNLRTDQLAVILDQSPERVDELMPVQSDATPPTSASMAGNYQLPPTPVTIIYRLAGREDVHFEWDGVLDRYEGVGIDVQSRTIAVRVRIDDPRASRMVNRNQSQRGTSNLDSRQVPTLLRGMFVETVFKTRPRRPLVLVPKLAVRPGGEVWRFRHDPAALQQLADRVLANRDAQATATPAEDAEAPANVSVAAQGPRPEDWEVGRIDVINDVQLVRLIESQPEPTVRPISVQADSSNNDATPPRPVSRLAASQGYWAVQASEDLPVGSPVIVTPLAAILGDGSDIVRTDELVSPQ